MHSAPRQSPPCSASAVWSDGFLNAEILGCRTRNQCCTSIPIYFLPDISPMGKASKNWRCRTLKIKWGELRTELSNLPNTLLALLRSFKEWKCENERVKELTMEKSPIHPPHSPWWVSSFERESVNMCMFERVKVWVFKKVKVWAILQTLSPLSWVGFMFWISW